MVALSDLGPSVANALKPKSEILRAGRSDDMDPKIHKRHADAADRNFGQRPVIEILPFDQDIGETRACSELSELGPERALNDRGVKTTDGLPLHDRAFADLIVSGPQTPSLNSYAELTEKPRHAAGALMNVGDDTQHVKTIAQHSQPTHHSRVPTQHQLALSRSESA